MTPSFSLALTGSGGAGVMTAGQLLLDAAALAGRYGLMARSFGPQIRGGEAAALLRLARRPVECPDDDYDLLVALDWGNIERFADELPLAAGAVIIADPGQGGVPEVIATQAGRIHEIAISQLARDIPGGRPNMVALGIAAALADVPGGAVETRVRQALARHGDESVAAAIACLAAGRAAALEVTGHGDPPSAAPSEDTVDAGAPGPHLDRWVLNGNEATGFGALAAGVRFCAAYPITPATEILEWLAGRLPRVGGRLVQAEDELASINMCIGASFGGVPALTATAGPGLSLMIESLGLAVAAEVPLVVANVMRGGPSTGIPTKSEQTDLNIAVYGLHGEAPHVVVAPTGVGDCAPTAAWAVSLAETLQTPVILLSDQALGQTRTIVDPPGGELARAGRRRYVAGHDDSTETYRRYAMTADGISPMSCPGLPGGQYTADGLTHTEHGIPSTRAEDHVGQLDKRRRKLEEHDYGPLWGDLHGAGDIAVITWGSATQPVREACQRAEACGLAVRLVALRLLSPVPASELEAALGGVRACLVVEHNHSGQLYRHLRAWTELPHPTLAWHRPGPLPLRPGEILGALQGLHAQLEAAA